MLIFSRLRNVLTSSKNKDILVRSLINLLHAKGFDDVPEQTILISLEDTLKNQLDQLKGPNTRYLVSAELLVDMNVHIVQEAIKLIENLDNAHLRKTLKDSEFVERFDDDKQHRVIKRQEIKVDRLMNAVENNHNATKDKNVEEIFAAKKVTPKNFWT